MTVKIKDVTGGYIKEIEALKAERDALLQELHKANSIIIDLQRNPPKFTAEYLRDVRAEAGRAGYEYGALQWCFNSSDMGADIERSAETYSNWILKGANPLAGIKVRQGGAE